MKFTLIGGTGNIGKAIANVLDNKGYSYSNISRNIAKSKQTLKNAEFHCDFSEKNLEKLYDIIEKSDVIINLAGSSIAGAKWTDKYKKDIYNSRITTTNKITEILNKFPHLEKVLVSTSAIGYYGNRGDELLDEHSEPADDFLAKVCKDWESAALNVHSNIRVAIPRVGVVLDKSSGALEKMLLPFKLFIGGPLGSGEQWFSWIHIEDLANLYVEMAENERYHGIFNAVSPNTLQMKDFAKSLGVVLRRPSVFRVPEFLLKFLLGESASMILSSQRVSAQRVITKMFKFKYPELDKALESFKF